eukprot:CAMPEP_0115156920 /NCGR_PEP_ID=MMETSP0227-20121206/68738_1 /TAXON_ID=89957 /ORGANISM="Polarella glacialis, Strain CCMP 1383" /LENGTH=45 /DNA_ID= /DNA_START= /DNA_END= /DNA_ORIENTATION=
MNLSEGLRVLAHDTNNLLVQGPLGEVDGEACILRGDVSPVEVLDV